LDAATGKKYLDELEELTNNIRDMFEKQAAAAEVCSIFIRTLYFVLICAQQPWDQEHFENLLAKFIVATDQPFSAVDGKEFRELLQYTHHPAKRKLKIPHATAVKVCIMDLGEEIVDRLKKTFVVGIHCHLCFMIRNSFPG
jgi:hypothetical protein